MIQYQKFVKDIGLIGIVQMLTNLRGILLLPIIAKSLGAESYGIWSQLIIALNVLSPIVLLGMPNALIRFLPGAKDKKEIREQLWSTLLLVIVSSILGALLLISFKGFIEATFGIPSILLVYLSVLLIFQPIHWVLVTVFRAFQETRKLVAFLFLPPAGEVLIAGAILSAGYGLQEILLSLIILRILLDGSMFFLVLRKVGLSFPQFSFLKEYLRFGIPTVIGSLSYRIVQIGDTYLIAGLLGALFVGYYSPAYSFGNMLNMIVFPVAMILPPILAKLFAEKNIPEIQTYLRHTLKYMLLILIPAVFGLSVLSKQILLVFATEDIASQGFLIIPFIATGFLFYGAYGVFAQIFGLFKKTKIIAVLWIGAALCNIILNLLFIPFFGIIGAAIATLLTYFLVCFLAWRISFRYLSFPIDWKILTKSLLASAIMGILLFFLPAQGLIQLIAAVLFGALVYFTCMLFFKAFQQKELDFLKSLLRSTP